MNRRGNVTVLAMLLVIFIALFLLVSITGTKPLTAIMTEIPSCGFPEKDKIESFVWEDFSRSNIEVIDAKHPPPKGWVDMNPDRPFIGWDPEPGKIDCGQGCAQIVYFGSADAMNRFGSYVSQSAGWDVYRSDYDLKKQRIQLDLKSVDYVIHSRQDIGSIYDQWYIEGTDSNGKFIQKQVFFGWGIGSDIATNRWSEAHWHPAYLRFCIDPIQKVVTVLTTSDINDDNGKTKFYKSVDLSGLKGERWILGLQGSTSATDTYFGTPADSSVKPASISAPMLASIPNFNAFEYNSSFTSKDLASLSVRPVEFTSSMHVDDIMATTYNTPKSPITDAVYESPKKAEEPKAPVTEQPSPQVQKPEQKPLTFGQRIIKLFSSLLEIIKNLFP